SFIFYHSHSFQETGMPLKPHSLKTLCTAMAMTASMLMTSAHACTRFVYHGQGDEIITARSMDWKVDVGTNLWVFPRGMQRTGEAGPNSIQWKSKYGSVIAS